MQSYISHLRGTVFYYLTNFLSSKSSSIHLLQKISEIIENVIFSLISNLQEIWYFVSCGKSRKYDIYVERFYEKCCFSCSVFFVILLLVLLSNFIDSGVKNST